jgi:predicted enzyme related to lactoylglutathione lyase
MLSFNSLLLFSEDPKKLSEFYKQVFNVDPGWTDGDWSGFQVGNNHVVIGAHSEVKGKNKTPQRMMFNLETTNVKEEFIRIKGYGTTVIAEPYQMGEGDSGWIATFADPDGNYFQLTTPMG